MTHIPMLDLKREYEYMKDDIDAAIRRCLDHQHWILGPEVKEFEDRVAKYLGVEHCIGVSSGTDALVLALRALAIKTKGQEYFDRSDLIITTPFTFTATGAAILRAGATPVFVDIDPITYNIDPAQIRRFLTDRASSEHFSPLAVHSSQSQVVGILPVHLYGQSCRMDEIISVANEFGLFVVEDVAQAFGCSLGGKKLGSIGACGAFSFFPSKNLGGFGDGGMISTDDDETAQISRMLVKHGGKDKYNVQHIGYNARIDTLQAAVLLAKLTYIDEFNKRRRNIAFLYSEQLKELTDIVLPIRGNQWASAGVSSFSSNCKPPAMYPLSFVSVNHVFHQYTIRILNGKKNILQSFLENKGITTMIYYPVPLQKMRVFHGRCEVYGQLSQAERASNEVLSLPISPLLTDEEVIDIALEAKVGLAQ